MAKFNKWVKAVGTVDSKGKEQTATITVISPQTFADMLDGVKKQVVMGKLTSGAEVRLTEQFVVQAIKEKIISDVGVNWRTQFRAKTTLVGGKKVEVEQVNV